ncbi:hypothetical protein [Streptomyces sp. DB-54]
MSNQSQHGYSDERDAVVSDALRQAEAAVVVDGDDLARRREALLGWMADRIEADPEPPSDGAKAEVGAAGSLALTEMATVAAALVVAALGTGQEARMRAVVARLLWRARRETAEMVLARFDRSSVRLRTTRDARSIQLETVLVAEWAAQLVSLLQEIPEAVDDLRQLIEELHPTVRSVQHSVSVNVVGHAYAIRTVDGIHIQGS